MQEDPMIQGFALYFSSHNVKHTSWQNAYLLLVEVSDHLLFLSTLKRIYSQYLTTDFGLQVLFLVLLVVNMQIK